MAMGDTSTLCIVLEIKIGREEWRAAPVKGGRAVAGGMGRVVVVAFWGRGIADWRSPAQGPVGDPQHKDQ